MDRVMKLGFNFVEDIHVVGRSQFLNGFEFGVEDFLNRDLIKKLNPKKGKSDFIEGQAMVEADIWLNYLGESQDDRGKDRIRIPLSVYNTGMGYGGNLKAIDRLELNSKSLEVNLWNIEDSNRPSELPDKGHSHFRSGVKGEIVSYGLGMEGSSALNKSYSVLFKVFEEIKKGK
jgi:hypothetical protein